MRLDKAYMSKGKNDSNRRMYCLRVYLTDKRQQALVKAAARISQRTVSPNLSQFARDVIVEQAERIKAEFSHTKHTIPNEEQAQ